MLSLAVLCSFIVLGLYYLYDEESGQPHPLLTEIVTLARNYILSQICHINSNTNYQDRNRDDHCDPIKSWSLVIQRDQQGLPMIAETRGTVDGKITKFSKSVTDPFQCLEDSQHPSTREYLEIQQQITQDYMEQSESYGIYQKFSSRFLATQNYESIENPINLGGTYFFFKRLRPELPQFSLFATKDLNVEARLVFDPNTLRINDKEIGSLSIEGKAFDDDPLAGMLTVHGTWISVDGYRLAYGFTFGSDSKAMHIGVRDLVSGNDLSDDIISGAIVDYTNVAWVESRTGFFYTTVVELESPESIFANRIMFHKLGKNAAEDLVVFETLSKLHSIVANVQVTSDGHYLLLELFQRKEEASSSSAWGSVIPENTSNLFIGNKVYYYDLAKFDGEHVGSLGQCVRLIDTFMHRFDYISNIEDEFWFRTNYRAPNFRVVRITLPDLTHDDQIYLAQEITQQAVHSFSKGGMNREAYKCLQSWKSCLDWIPQRNDGVFLESGYIAAHTVLVLKYAKNASHEVLLYDLTQDLVLESQIPVADLPHPSHGTISGPNCNFYSSEIFYQYSDFSDPSSIYRALIDRDPYTGAIEISFSQVNSTEIPGIDKYKFEIQQEFVETKKDIVVPILKFGLRNILNTDEDENLIALDKADLLNMKEEESISKHPNGSSRQSSFDPRIPRPCIIYVNSGFGISVTPTFSLPFALFAYHCKGIVVVANLQGSGVFGKSWASSGMGERKEEAINDLMYVIKYLVKHNFTTFAQIALYGGAHNGSIIGAAIAQFPMMFNAAVIEDGIFDLMKHHILNPLKHDLSWKRSFWYQEFGCYEESESEFNRLLDISPLHNIHKNIVSSISTYPAVLCLTGKEKDFMFIQFSYYHEQIWSPRCLTMHILSVVHIP